MVFVTRLVQRTVPTVTVDMDFNKCRSKLFIKYSKGMLVLDVISEHPETSHVFILVLNSYLPSMSSESSYGDVVCVSKIY